MKIKSTTQVTIDIELPAIFKASSPYLKEETFYSFKDGIMTRVMPQDEFLSIGRFEPSEKTFEGLDLSTITEITAEDFRLVYLEVAKKIYNQL